MVCDRLKSLIKSWYLKVQEELMAPARMVAFMEQHMEQCEECRNDPDIKREAAKIREIVLPPSKVPKPKAVKPKVAAGEGEAEEVDDNTEDEDDEEEATEDEDPEEGDDGPAEDGPEEDDLVL